MTHLKIVKPSTDGEKTVQITHDVVEVTPDELREWAIPPFQREKRINDKVREVADQIRKDDGVIPDPLVISRLDGKVWLVDGQHRREAAYLSGCPILYAEVRILHVKTFDEMRTVFKRINAKLVPMRADDNLRASEGDSPALRRIHEACPFTSYNRIVRGGKVAVSMSILLRSWFAAVPDAPSTSGLTVNVLVESVGSDESHIIEFAKACWGAWEADEANKRLWGLLNLALCAWLYQRMVMSPKPKTTRLTTDMFKRCLMSVAADAEYNAWLTDRALRERDRSPAYNKLKKIFAKRIALETGDKAFLPQPAWAAH